MLRRALLLLLPAAALGIVLIVLRFWPTETGLPPEAKADRLLVEKSRRLLHLYQKGRLLKTYRIALGTSPVGPKQREGDKKTPEGLYTITERKSDSAFHLALRISYPSPEDAARAAREGVNPGFDIMIHGLPNGQGHIGRAHLATDWTAGCIAVTNEEIEEIFAAVPVGTPIEIRP